MVRDVSCPQREPESAFSIIGLGGKLYRGGMRTYCLHFASEREQIVPKIEAVAAL